MARWFRIEKVVISGTFHKPQNIKSQQNAKGLLLGEVILEIPSVSVPKYSSHALTQILSSFFDNQACLTSYKHIQKALQIASVPQIDNILKSDMQKMIVKNINRKKDIYVFLCLWTQYLSIQKILQRFQDKKTQQTLIYLLLFVYLTDSSNKMVGYQNSAVKIEIEKILLKNEFDQNAETASQIDADIVAYINEEMANFKVLTYSGFVFTTNKLIGFLKVSSTFFSNFSQTLLNFLKNEQNQKFILQLVQDCLNNEQSRKKTESQKIVEFITHCNIKYAKDIIEKAFNKKLQCKFNSEKKSILYEFVREIFSGNKSKHKKRQFKREFVKNWISSCNKNTLWSFFTQNYFINQFGSSQIQNKQIRQKNIFLLEFLDQVSNQNEIIQIKSQNMVFLKYLSHFFEGKVINFGLELSFLDQKQAIKLQAERQVLRKGLGHIRNEGFLNILSFNKTSFPLPIQWKIDISLSQMLKKYDSVPGIRKVLLKVIQSWIKIEEDMSKKNRKLELVYNVIRISIDKKISCVTVQQLAEILKPNSEDKILQMNFDSYKRNYRMVSEKTQSQIENGMVAKDQQIHPVIIEARIIKLMKKEVRKKSIFQISKALGLKIQKTQQVIKKLVNKGFLQDHQDETYSYEA